jgi:uncharacterized membrane protein
MVRGTDDRDNSPMQDAVPVFATPLPHVRRVAVDRPWTWLAAGWNDVLAAAPISLGYGLVIAAISIALLALLIGTEHVHLVMPLAAGFFLVAPLLAVGLYETSRRLSTGEKVSFTSALAAFRTHHAQIANMGVVLLLIHLIWVRVATLIYAVFFHSASPSLQTLVDTLLFSSASLPFLAVGTIVGAVLAVVVFSISAISLPMLLDRDVGIVTAMVTSMLAVRLNWKPMALWAALIVVFTAVGMATFMLGLIVAMPLVGHATWHAYRDLVAFKD